MADVADHNEQEIRWLAEASAWRVALFEDGLTTSPAFEAWLAAEPGHESAWRQVCGPWDLLDANAMAPELIVARRDALERARRTQRRRLGSRWTSGVRPWAIAACLAAALVLVLAGGGVWWANRGDDYQTAQGERRTITLADGSVVTLDSSTRLRVKLRAHRRALELLQGQARFDVAHDAHRPFTVHAGDRTVVATGTSFNIDLVGSHVVVTLIQGSVSVTRSAAPALFTLIAPRAGVRPAARLSPGQQLVSALPTEAEATLAKPEGELIQTVSIERATAWETGQLMFDNDRLSSVIEQMGRYSRQPVVVDASAANLRLSGVFEVGDLNTFIDAVQRALPVEAVQSDDGAIHLRRRRI